MSHCVSSSHGPIAQSAFSIHTPHPCKPSKAYTARDHPCQTTCRPLPSANGLPPLARKQRIVGPQLPHHQTTHPDPLGTSALTCSASALPRPGTPQHHTNNFHRTSYTPRTRARLPMLFCRAFCPLDKQCMIIALLLAGSSPVRNLGKQGSHLTLAVRMCGTCRHCTSSMTAAQPSPGSAPHHTHCKQRPPGLTVPRSYGTCQLHTARMTSVPPHLGTFPCHTSGTLRIRWTRPAVTYHETCLVCMPRIPVHSPGSDTGPQHSQNTCDPTTRQVQPPDTDPRRTPECLGKHDLPFRSEQ